MLFTSVNSPTIPSPSANNYGDPFRGHDQNTVSCLFWAQTEGYTAAVYAARANLQPVLGYRYGKARSTDYHDGKWKTGPAIQKRFDRPAATERMRTNMRQNFETEIIFDHINKVICKIVRSV